MLYLYYWVDSLWITLVSGNICGAKCKIRKKKRKVHIILYIHWLAMIANLYSYASNYLMLIKCKKVSKMGPWRPENLCIDQYAVPPRTRSIQQNIARCTTLKCPIYVEIYMCTSLNRQDQSQWYVDRLHMCENTPNKRKSASKSYCRWFHQYKHINQPRIKSSYLTQLRKRNTRVNGNDTLIQYGLVFRLHRE